MAKQLGLYLHIPFCAAKCAYCDFLSAPADDETKERYVMQLEREIACAREKYVDYEITSIFMGGGTPSILPPEYIRRLFQKIRQCFFVRPDAEVTIECNPGTLDRGKLVTYRECGVSRLSIGLQSADGDELRLLGRIHSYGDFLQNYMLAREIGFDNINIDLICSLPGQSEDNWRNTLESVMALGPEHISAYSLMIEEGTPFYVRYGRADRLRSQGMPQSLLPDEDEERRMYALTKTVLSSHGYGRYEISNYALPGRECRHNTGYWTRENYLGLGCGAASLVENTRFCNVRDLKRYLALDFSDERGRFESRQELSVGEQMEEFMFLGLRMTRGVSSAKFRRLFSRGILDVYGGVIERQVKDGLLAATESGYCLTDYGTDVSNYVMAQYLL